MLNYPVAMAIGRGSRRGRVRSVVFLVMGTSSLVACSLLTNFDGYTGGAPASEGGSDSSASDVIRSVDGCAPNLVGHWAATASVKVFGAFEETVTGQAELAQDCTTVTGSMTLQACISNGTVQGTIDADGGFTATISSGDVTATAKGALSNPNEIDGDFTLPGGGSCPAQGGTFQLRRQ